MYQAQIQCNYTLLEESRISQELLQNDFKSIFISRACIIGFSAIILIFNLVLIVKKKQYRDTSIKYFALIEIFYFFALISVAFRNFDCSLGIFLKTSFEQMQNLMECIIDENKSILTAIQGFVNLSCYSISYWFAVNLAIYIKLKDQSEIEQFHRLSFKRISIGIIIIVIWYLIPFILTFISDMPFSFGPTGYQYYENYFYLYVGIVNRGGEQIVYKILIILWMLLIPLSCMIYHLSIICSTSRINQDDNDELQKRSQFIRQQSANISRFLLFVQVFNVGKFVLMIFEIKQIWVLIYALNIIYDLLALWLLRLYYQYYHRIGYKQSQTILETNYLSQQQYN